ncbi:hypothetical protein [Streptomyces ziwulingensis]|uniref:hypothetical protein n=1 Tax=Streptomyces ziwulingensis TaxID=1045501 RepID=UPI0031E910F3
MPCAHGNGSPPCDVHLCVDADSPERSALVDHADVLVSHVPLPPGPAHRRARELLDDHPGCLAAAVPDTATRCVVGVRDATGAVSWVHSEPLRAEPPRPQSPRAQEPAGPGAPVPAHAVALVGSVVHAWVVSGRPARTLRSVAPVPRR